MRFFMLVSIMTNTITQFQNTTFGSSFKDNWQTEEIHVDHIERVTPKAALFGFGWVPASIIKECITGEHGNITHVVLPKWFCIKNNI